MRKTEIRINLCIFLDIFIHFSLKTRILFRKLPLLPFAGEQPNQLGPLEEADHNFHLSDKHCQQCISRLSPLSKVTTRL